MLENYRRGSNEKVTRLIFPSANLFGNLYAHYRSRPAHDRRCAQKRGEFANLSWLVSQSRGTNGYSRQTFCGGGRQLQQLESWLIYHVSKRRENNDQCALH